MRIQFLIGIALLTSACELNPTGPTIVPGPVLAPASTARPGVWDTRPELTPWIQNITIITRAGEVASLPEAATIVGDGSEAAIRVDLTRYDQIRLQGPSFDPPLDGVRAARIRYRWVDARADDEFWMSLWLRPPAVAGQDDIRQLSNKTVKGSQAGEWVESQLQSSGSSVAVRFSMLELTGADRSKFVRAAGHGSIEIDWIALVR